MAATSSAPSAPATTTSTCSRDEDDFVWIGVHFGSRGLGHKTATKYIKAAGGHDGMDVPPAVVEDDSELGTRYLAAMQLAGRYAYAGREWVVETVRRMLGAKVTDTRAQPSQLTPGASATASATLGRAQGRDAGFPGPARLRRRLDGRRRRDPGRHRQRALARGLHSTVHGAGRVCGRVEAKGKRDRKTGEWIQAAALHARGDGRVDRRRRACT